MSTTNYYQLSPYCFYEPQRHDSKLSEFAQWHALKLHKSATAEYVAFRLLLGGIEITNEASNRSFGQHTSYFSLPPRSYDVDTVGLITLAEQSLKPLPFFYTSFVKTFDEIGAKANNDFYKEFTLTVCRSLEAKSSGEYEKSFISLYRAIEHMSFAIPLLYLSNNTNYRSSFQKFKKFFKQTESELGVGRSLLFDIMDQNILSAPCIVDFSGHPAGHEKIVKALYGSGKKPFQHFVYDDQFRTLTFPFSGCWDAIIKLRNSYFHHLYGQNQSISAIHLEEPDRFFSVFYEIFMSFVANFFLTAFTIRYERRR